MSPKPPNVLLNVIANWAAWILSAGVAFFLSPYVIDRLGNTGYGIWAIIGGVVGYLGLLDLGVRGAVTRYVARFQAQNDGPKTSAAVSSAVALFIGVGMLALVIAVGVALAIPAVGKIPAEHVRVAQISLVIAGFTVAISLIGGIYGGCISGMQRFTILSSTDILLEMVRAAAVVVALRWGYGILALALIQAGVAITRLMIFMTMARRIMTGLRVSTAAVDRGMIGAIISFGGYATLIHTSGRIILNSDSIVIGSLISVAAVTPFMVGANLVEYTRTVLSGISHTIPPMVSAAQAANRPDQVAFILRRSLRLGMVAIAPILATFLIRGRTFIELWQDPAYRDSSGPVLELLTVGLCASTSYHMVTVTMLGLNRHRLVAPVFVVEAILNLGLSIALAGSFGITGVAVGTLIPRLVVALFVGPTFARTQVGIPLATFAREAWVRPALAVLPFVAASQLVERFWPAQSLLAFFGQVFTILPLAFLGAWLIALEQSEKDQIMRLGKRLVAPLAGRRTAL